jgi:hypothetical protein
MGLRFPSGLSFRTLKTNSESTLLARDSFDCREGQPYSQMLRNG